MFNTLSQNIEYVGRLSILFALSGCAAFSGDFKLSGKPTGNVAITHEHKGSAQEFVGVGALPYYDGGPRLHIGRATIYIANETDHTIFADVACPHGGWADYPIESMHKQGFAEWDGECQVVLK